MSSGKIEAASANVERGIVHGSTNVTDVEEKVDEVFDLNSLLNQVIITFLIDQKIVLS